MIPPRANLLRLLLSTGRNATIGEDHYEARSRVLRARLLHYREYTTVPGKVQSKIVMGAIRVQWSQMFAIAQKCPSGRKRLGKGSTFTLLLPAG